MDQNRVQVEANRQYAISGQNVIAIHQLLGELKLKEAQPILQHMDLYLLAEPEDVKPITREEMESIVKDSPEPTEEPGEVVNEFAQGPEMGAPGRTEYENPQDL